MVISYVIFISHNKLEINNHKHAGTHSNNRLQNVNNAIVYEIKKWFQLRRHPSFK